MKHRLIMTAALVLGACLPATAQTVETFSNVRKIEMIGLKPNLAPAPAKAAAAVMAPFGCEARGGGVCHFRIFYPAGRARDIVLPAGMKTSLPDVRVGQDSYCVMVNKKPAHKCQRRAISASYNS